MSELMEVKVFQTYDTTQCVTSFNYLASGTPAVVSQSFGLSAAMGFVDGFQQPGSDIFAAWKASVSSQLTITEIQTRSVYSVTDFYTLPISSSNTGSQGGTPSTSFNAFAFQTNRVRADIRRGSRRLVGVSEDSITEFGEVVAIDLALLETLATNFSDTLTYDDEGNTLTFTPCVVSKERYTTPAGKDAYRYYEDENTQLTKIAQGVLWSAKTFITSQVSRKRGRGI